MIEIPQDVRSSGNIVADIYGDSINYLNEEDLDDISSKTILTPKNSDTLKLNNELLGLLDGNATVYNSVDSLDSTDEGDDLNYQTEFLNSLTPSGMAPHELKLKKGSIIMLIRNLIPKEEC